MGALAMRRFGRRAALVRRALTRGPDRYKTVEPFIGGASQSAPQRTDVR
jgi:hypothetical protein